MTASRAYAQAAEPGTIPSASNPVLNSSFDIWQRGTSLTTTAIDADYTADRWYSYTSGATSGRTISRQATGDTTNLPFIEYCARVQRDSGNTSTAQWQFFQPFETTNSIPFAGRTVTMSFYARRGANFSSASNVLRAILSTGTGTDQNPINGYTGGADAIDQNVTLTTTWQRFSLTGNVGSSVKEISPNFIWIPSGTAGAADFYEITGVQIDIGSVALPYRRSAATLAGELAACQRYYYLHVNDRYYTFAQGYYANASNVQFYTKFPVTMRTTPSLVMASGTNYYQSTNGSDLFNSGTISQAHTNGALIFNNSEVSGTSGQGTMIETREIAASVAFSAEL